MSKYNRCVICSYKFDNPENFPNDFPKEWRICCVCRSYARYIIESGGVEIYITAWISIIREDRRHAFSEKMRKISRLISLN